MSASRSPLRLVRGGTAASIATAVALGGHLAGGGAMPAWLGILVPWWLAVAVCTLLAGTQFSLARMGVAVLASQALFHGLFSAGTPGDPGRALVDPPGSHLGHGAGHAGHGNGGVAGHGALGSGGEGVASVADHALHGSHSDLRMLLLHVLAATVTAVLLQHGESVLMRCARLALSVLAVLAHPPLLLLITLLVPERPARPLPAAPHLLHAQRAVLTPQLRRGPPEVLAA
ncbi:hypothetical protein [Brachybacterium sp. GU-2]|uniref:hypothetical protein n=1 Tax=Brachybacterium sp. GU-2 TaxID=3069708 RepID=UPI00280BEA1C|nr:hypothetical protein [Brachybacterium sp. GU-2]WME22699.1 hypothetical protein RBL05_14370 [Brachybacterium sp. GU-2]